MTRLSIISKKRFSIPSKAFLAARARGTTSQSSSSVTAPLRRPLRPELDGRARRKTGVYSRPIRESLAGARPPVNVGPRWLPQQSKSVDRGRTIMALKITEREVDGVTVLEMEGRIVLGEETVGTSRKSEGPARHGQEETRAGSERRHDDRQLGSRRAGQRSFEREIRWSDAASLQPRIADE